MKSGSDTLERHIMFRDFLQNHLEFAQKYIDLKRKLAEKYGADREGYTNAEADFIASVIDQASRNE
jgi:GrpB-like predicted nucleotidyltransferase (UPF0157 family)